MDEDAARMVKELWALGDYARLAERLQPAAGEVAAVAGPGDGRAALDVAAGTGSLALALARGGWTVTASDIAPALIAAGRDRTERAGQPVDWHEASLDDLPFAAGSFELVGSSFGLIFAPDAAAALAEARRVLRPGGRIVFSAWTPGSYIAAITAAMAAFMPDAAAYDWPFRWGDPAAAAGRLTTAGFGDVVTTVHTLPWAFGSAAEATDFVFAYSPAHVATRRQLGERGDAMMDAVREHLATLAEPDGSIRIAAEYAVTAARRK